VDLRAGLDPHFPKFSILLLLPATSPLLTEKGQKYENVSVLLHILLRTQVGLDAKTLVVGTQRQTVVTQPVPVFLAYSSTVRTETTQSSETSENFY
jgi:hypothetical protein